MSGNALLPGPDITDLGNANTPWNRVVAGNIQVNDNLTDGDNNLTIQELRSHLDAAAPGDMTRSVYDPDHDGKVVAAVTADSAGHVAGIDAAGTDRYYGTDAAGIAGFHHLPAAGGGMVAHAASHSLTGSDALSAAAVGAAAAVHTHTISDTSGLFYALGGKAELIHTHAGATAVEAGFLSTADKSKLDGIEAGAQVNAVSSVNGQTGAVALSRFDLGLGNVDNTADAVKPVSAAVQTALAEKAPNSHVHDDRYYTETETTVLLTGKSDTGHTHAAATTAVNGMLSASDKAKLDGIAAGATSTPLASVAPAMDGTAAAGGATTAARSDHVHPADTSRALASDLTAHTGAGSTNAHQIGNINGLQAALDARAPLNAAALTGTPTAPTAPALTDTPQIATCGNVYASVATRPGSNILINTDPANMINQRGNYSAGDTASFTFDRWQATQSTVSSAAAGITINGAGTNAMHEAYFIQTIENPPSFSGKNVTFSVTVANAAVGGLIVIVANGGWIAQTYWGVSSNPQNISATCTLPANCTALSACVVLRGVGAITIKNLKFEEGSIATPWCVPAPQQELARCMRYYQRVNLYSVRTMAETGFMTRVQFFVPMRTTPSVYVYDWGTNTAGYISVFNGSYTKLAATVDAITSTGARIGCPTTWAVGTYWNVDAYVIASAE